ncbi:heme uptake protein IsdC [Paenibacillus sp. UNC451MF]|uniref:heme uptake protein IsdC n=1 Tax=Paenibacillus sp. UNC451MF TaxID=1449063 RepID=UPI0006913B39|nr:heme uptake protein IsdC [Paenibacillus sp. UNC451MF]
MKKWLVLPFVMIMFSLTIFTMPVAQAASLADGTYTVDYTIKQAENDSASMANDYFEKPATVVVKNGEAALKIQMNHSKWITQFKVPEKDGFVDAKVVSSDSANDTRVVQFTADDLSKPLLSKIHVTVKEIDYDHDYTIRFVFDSKSIKSIGSTEKAADSGNAVKTAETPPKTESAEASTKAAETKSSAAPSAVKEGSASAAPVKEAIKTPDNKVTAVNPKTGDGTPIVGLVSVLAASSLLLAFSLRLKKSGR